VAPQRRAALRGYSLGKTLAEVVTTCQIGSGEIDIVREPQILVPRKALRLGLGLALHLAGLASLGCVFCPRDVGRFSLFPRPRASALRHLHIRAFRSPAGGLLAKRRAAAVALG
jgi:hypothetical protein